MNKKYIFVETLKHMTNLYKIISNNSKFKNCLKSLMFATSMIGWSNTANAQVSNYSFARTTGTFNTLTGGNVLATATANTGAASLYNVTYPVALPFPFVFNGNTFNNIQVTTNGYITFGGNTTTITATPISETVDNWQGVVSAWGRANQAAFYAASNVAGDVRWDVVGTAPNREMVIQWTNFRPIYSTTLTTIHAFSFQIRLKESTNEVVTTYNTGTNLVGTTAITGTSQIGLRGSSSLDYNNRLNASTLAFGSSTAGTANTSTQYFSTSSTVAGGMPAAGLTYTWTPPTCFTPDLLTSTSTTNSITVSWLAPTTPAPASYDIYYNTTGVVPTSTTTPSVTGVTGTSTTIGSLPTLTSYYIWVRSNCGSGNASAWSVAPLIASTKWQELAVLTTTGTTVCPNSTATLNATGEPGATLVWYDSVTGGNQLGTGTSYTTPVLTTTTNYWVSAANVYAPRYAGLAAASSSATSGAGTTNFGIVFDVFSACTLDQVTIYPVSSTGASGTVTIQVLSSSGAVLHTKTVSVTGSPAASLVPTVVDLGFNLDPGTNFKIRPAFSGISGLLFEPSASAPSGNYGYPFIASGVLKINTSTLTAAPTNTERNDLYYYFYNLKVTPKCESARTQVTATVDAACLGTSEISAKESLKVYPNPFTDYINITNVDKVKSAKVLDLTGRVVKTIGQVTSTINLSELQSGVYLLNLELKDGSVTSHKIMKK